MRGATGETRSNTADHRTLGISARRQNNVTKLIEMFEKHRHEEQFLKDTSEKQEINKFSEESQQSLADMNQTEVFELCDNSAKHLCLGCNAFSEIGIIYCSCGRNLKYSRSPTTILKTNCDFTSMPGFVIEKNSSRGQKHGVSERQVMFYRPKQMLKKARQTKHGNHPTILSRWYEQEDYRQSLAEHKIGEKQVMLFHRIALERRDYTATKDERRQNAKRLILRLNADGPQKPLRQRQEFAVAFFFLKKKTFKCQTLTWGNTTISETDTSRTSTTSTTRSTIRRRRKLRSLCRSENWMAVLQRATGKPVGSIFIFIFNIAVADYAMANELELMAAYII